MGASNPNKAYPDAPHLSEQRPLPRAESVDTSGQVDWRRYRQLGWFFAKAIWHFLWWDIILNRPILRAWRSDPTPRWQQTARAYCTLATSMGGLPVKLGQFLSLRVDLLPPAITNELAVLQDRAPTVPTADIIHVIETDLASPIQELFDHFSIEAAASASLAQVHWAHLPSGEPVVVKVLRPGIAGQIEMDLAAMGLLVRTLKRFPQIRRQVDLDRVFSEFSTVTRRELDLVAEGKHAERFARAFATDTSVYIPKVYWAYTSTHTLTLENVAYLPIDDVGALTAAGIQCTQVAQQLSHLYIKQMLVLHFIHADPHPGNLFIKPLPHPDEPRLTGFAPGTVVPYWPDRPFQIVLIDFGMAAEIPEQDRRWLREFIIGIGLRDPHRIVQAYVLGGILRPDVDLVRMEAMMAELLTHFQETLVGLMPNMQATETRIFLAEYQDLLREYPFQIPMNLLFLYRALNILGSITRQLDPDFDLSSSATPFATQLLWQTWQKEWQEWFQDLTTLGSLLLASPTQPDRLLLQARVVLKAPPPFAQLAGTFGTRPALERSVQTGLVVKDRKLIQQLIKAVERLTWAVMVIGLLQAFVLWRVELRSVSLLEPLIQHPGGLGLLFLLTPLFFFIRWWLLR